jgi:uridine kinase
MPDRPRIIGIAGPSCSGKTTLARALAQALRGGATVVGLDAYYHDFSGVPEPAIHVDVPDAIDSRLLIEQMLDLAAGRAIERPVYDYATHTRSAQRVRVEPAGHVVVEGLFALYWPALRALYDLAVFVDADHDTCLSRRVDRDVRERGRTRESVVEVYRNKVRPMYELHVAPTRARADIVVSGLDGVDEMVSAVAGRLGPPGEVRPGGDPG